MGEDSVFWWGGSEPSPVPPLVATPDPHKKHSEECGWSDYYNNFKKSVKEYFTSKQQIYNM